MGTESPTHVMEFGITGGGGELTATGIVANGSDATVENKQTPDQQQEEGN